MESVWTFNQMLCATGAAVRARELARHPWHARLNGLGQGPPATRRRPSGSRRRGLHLAVAMPTVPAFPQALPAGM